MADRRQFDILVSSYQKEVIAAGFPEEDWEKKTIAALKIHRRLVDHLCKKAEEAIKSGS